ncbi:NAD(P)-dependent alcohol dehydrogenase [Elioraea sp.]|uniref:NAD(P)-dependent alcohol dehydrogenase n=1 Tax=Elioraea sp. TaxID=2185103 RepID=UPI0025BEACDA|nr:NAD(P)-dependent alcohol dehydrogenase [Elioraea sp.]
MRAWVARSYGGPEVLALREVKLPQPGPGEVLIRVEATTVSSADRRIRALDLPAGMALMGRLALGLRRPRRAVLGVELTGRIAAVGAGVTRFAPGDAVIAFPGFRQGAHAEFAVMPAAGMVVARPACMSVETAAALGFGGTTARDYLRRARLREGERVLVIGASGTVGAALVQLAIAAGAIVSAVTSTGNVALVQGMGAAEVIDYTGRDYTAGPDRWDIVADAAAALSFRTALPILAEGGRYLAIAGGLGDLLARRRGSRRPIAGPAAERPDDLAALADLAARGLFRPPIDAVFPFDALPAAHARADTGRKRGSLVVLLESPSR